MDFLPLIGDNLKYMNNCLSQFAATKNSSTIPCRKLRQPKIHEQLLPADGSDQKFMNNCFPQFVAD